MAEVLELPHLVEQHGVAEVQIRRRRIEAGLDAQRAAELQARLELLALDDLVGAAADQIERVLQIGHWNSCWWRSRTAAPDPRFRSPIGSRFNRPKSDLPVNYWLTTKCTQTRAAIGN